MCLAVGCFLTLVCDLLRSLALCVSCCVFSGREDMSSEDQVPDPQDPVGSVANATLQAPIVPPPAPVVTASAGGATPSLSPDLVQVVQAIVREALATARAVSGGSEAGVSAATGKSLVTATVSPASGVKGHAWPA